MTITITADGINFTLGLTDKQTISRLTRDTKYAPRAVLEVLATAYSRNLERDVAAAVEGLSAGEAAQHVSE